MRQAERRRFLIDALLAERPELGGVAVPGDSSGQRRLLRALLNTRPAGLPSPEVLHVQDAYLQERLAERGGAVALDSIEPARPHLRLWQGDITRLACDAVVNAANSGMTGCWAPGHTCIDNCIHTFAGVQLRWECARLMERQGHPEPTGQAKVTAAYNLPCKRVVHTVGPALERGRRPDGRDQELLASSYRSCYRLAREEGLRSLAFCCISTGVFGFPQAQAAHIAVTTVTELQSRDPEPLEVVFDVFLDEDRALYEGLLG